MENSALRALQLAHPLLVENLRYHISTWWRFEPPSGAKSAPMPYEDEQPYLYYREARQLIEAIRAVESVIGKGKTPTRWLRQIIDGILHGDEGVQCRGHWEAQQRFGALIGPQACEKDLAP